MPWRTPPGSSPIPAGQSRQLGSVDLTEGNELVGQLDVLQPAPQAAITRVYDVPGAKLSIFADARGQNRPSFLQAARPEIGRPLLERFIQRLGASGLRVETGSFGAQMTVRIVNDGPVTIVLSTDSWEPRIG